MQRRAQALQQFARRDSLGACFTAYQLAQRVGAAAALQLFAPLIIQAATFIEYEEHFKARLTKQYVRRLLAGLGEILGVVRDIQALEQALEQKISATHGALPLQLGGPADAAQIINKSGKTVEKQIMARITKVDRGLARQIEAEMFRFEHLFELDGQAMGSMLREVDSETLVDALKGAAEPDREVFFAAMSSRAADGVRDEIDARGRIKMAEVEAAQKAMVDIARRLAADGVIAFGNSGDDEYV